MDHQNIIWNYIQTKSTEAIHSLAERRTGFHVCRIYAWGGFLGCPRPRRPLRVIWYFTQLPTKLHLHRTVPSHSLHLSVTANGSRSCAVVLKYAWTSVVTVYNNRLTLAWMSFDAVVAPSEDPLKEYFFSFSSIRDSKQLFVILVFVRCFKLWNPLSFCYIPKETLKCGESKSQLASFWLLLNRFMIYINNIYNEHLHLHLQWK